MDGRCQSPGILLLILINTFYVDMLTITNTYCRNVLIVINTFWAQYTYYRTDKEIIFPFL